MRRFKSSKTLAAAITLALTLGMSSVIYAADTVRYNSSINSNLNFNNTGMGVILIAPYNQNGKNYNAQITGDNISVSATNNGTGGLATIYSYGGYSFNIGTEDTQSVSVSTKLAQNTPYTLYANGTDSSITVKGKTIDISAETGANNSGFNWTNVGAFYGAQITLGDSNTQTITVNTTQTGAGRSGYAIEALAGGAKVNVNGDILNINVNTQVDGRGIHVGNNTSNGAENPADVVINTKNTNINVTSADNFGIALAAMSEGKLTVNNNLTVNADNAILARGHATVDINPNQDEKATVKLDGNIDFNYDAVTSGTTVDANVNINLTNSESYLHGNTVVNGENIPETKSNVTGMTVNASNGANWTTTANSFVNNLSLSNNATTNFVDTMTVLNNLDASSNSTVNAENLVLAGPTSGNTVGALATINNTAALNAKNVTISNQAQLNVNGTANITDTTTINDGGTVNVNGTMVSNNLTAANGATLTSTEGSNVTLNDAKLENGAIINLQGTTTINDNLTNNAGGTISNLVLSEPTTTVTGSGTTRVKNISLNDSVPFQQGGTYRTLNSNNEGGGEGGLDVSGATVDVTGLSVTGAAGSLRAGQTSQMTLLNNNTGKALGDLKGAKSQTFTSGTTLQGTGIASKDGDDVVYKINVSNEAQPQTHRAVMAHTAGLTTVFGGFDYLDRAAESMRDNGVNGFAAIGGGEHRYDTGSDIKTNAWHAIAGVGVKNAAQSGSITEYGIFYDYGDGHYRTSDSTGRGDGKAIYKGGGLFGKYKFDNDIYLEGSFRAGRVKNTSNGLFRDNAGNRYDLKTNSNYTAYHLGVGKIYNLDENNSMDVYAKYFRTHVNADNFNAGGHYDLDGVTSSILRIGTRWNHQSGDWTHYLGVAYEHEFDGEARGTADGAKIKSSDISGSSARFELGTTLEKGNWLLNLNADAYAGQHKGYDGSITLGYKF